MVSEIKGPGAPAPRSIDPATRGKVEHGSATTAATSNDAADVVTLTDLASRLQRLTDSVRDLPVVDQARVAELRDQIESGNYHADDKDIAEKLTLFEGKLGLKQGA